MGVDDRDDKIRLADVAKVLNMARSITRETLIKHSCRQSMERGIRHWVSNSTHMSISSTTSTEPRTSMPLVPTVEPYQPNFPFQYASGNSHFKLPNTTCVNLGLDALLPLD